MHSAAAGPITWDLMSVTISHDVWTVIETPIVDEWHNLGLTARNSVRGRIGMGIIAEFYNEVLPWHVFIPTTFCSP